MRRIFFSLVLISILLTLVISMEMVPSRAAGVPGSWTQTTRADFESGILNNLAYDTAQGGLQLSSGGALALMGAASVNRTALNGFCSCTWILNATGTAAPVSGIIVGYSYFLNRIGASLKLKIFRDNGTHYLLVGQSALSVGVRGYNHVDLSSSPISVHKGDLIAFYVDSTSFIVYDGGCTGNVPYQGVDASTSLKSSWNSWPCLVASLQADILPVVTGGILSSVKDAGGYSTWGTISWHAKVPLGTSLSLATRTSSDPLSWSSWSPASNGSSVASPQGRFIQYSALLVANGTLTPVLRDVSITFTTTPATSSIFLSISPGSLAAGSNITVTGMITPAISTSVVLTYIKPDGSTVNRTLTSNSVGFFSDFYVPDTAGTWKVRASSTPASTIAGATSAYSTFQVQAPPSFLSTILPWLILIVVIAGFGVAVLLTKPKAPKTG